MGVSSLDRQHLETLRQVGTLLDLLRNPESFQELVTAAAETAVRLEADINAHTTVEQASKFLADASAAVSRAKIEADNIHKRAADDLAKAQSDRQVTAEHVAAETSRIAEAWSALRKDELATREARKQLGDDKEAFDRRLEALEAREVAATKREREFQEKAAKDRQLVG